MIPVHLQIYFEEELLTNVYSVPQLLEWKLVTLDNKSDKDSENTDSDGVSDFIETINKLKNIRTIKLEMDGYMCSLFVHTIRTSLPYRTSVMKHIHNKKSDITRNEKINKIVVHVNMFSPKREMLDYRGNEMFEISCLERRELDTAMAWLSTLGGAFSALGDHTDKCAEIAGRISVRQLEIALRLGDPYLVARCKLYMALSMIQRLYFKKAQEVIQNQYALAVKGPVVDNRLKSMCLGIWTKLRYDKNKVKEYKKKNS